MRKLKRNLVFLAVFCITLSGAYAIPGLRIQEGLVMHSRILNMDVKYSVCLPEDYYSSTKAFPVVYLLHGLGDDESSWLEYGQISQYADKSVEAKNSVPMIFIMPQGFRNYYVNDYKGTFLYEDMFVKELVPFVDSMFRTIPDSRHRALMGYSMGGFGALNLHLKHPELFGTAVPLSISVRTDKQYMEEDSSGWNNQWGRLFGGVGLIGKERITPYYEQNSPFHLLEKMTAEQKSKLKIYIDNGDKEQTLCRSNEELHILMRKLNVPHQFRVRDGGHSFSYWCSALPAALNFISDAFQGKPYITENIPAASQKEIPGSFVRTIKIKSQSVNVFVPAEYDQSNRYYPVIYFAGELNPSGQNELCAVVRNQIADLAATPMILVFLPGNSISNFSDMLPDLEQSLRIRKGYRFRILMGYQDAADKVIETAVSRERFSACIITDGYLSPGNISGLLNTTTSKALENTSFFVDAPDQGSYYEGNGLAHMMMRDKDISHEYRVRPGSGGVEWMLAGLPEMLQFATIRFHK